MQASTLHVHSMAQRWAYTPQQAPPGERAQCQCLGAGHVGPPFQGLGASASGLATPHTLAVRHTFVCGPHVRKRGYLTAPLQRERRGSAPPPPLVLQYKNHYQGAPPPFLQYHNHFQDLPPALQYRNYYEGIPPPFPAIQKSFSRTPPCLAVQKSLSSTQVFNTEVTKTEFLANPANSLAVQKSVSRTPPSVGWKKIHFQDPPPSCNTKIIVKPPPPPFLQHNNHYEGPRAVTRGCVKR